MQHSSDIAFSPAVKAIQAARGSREAYARLEARGGFRTALTPDLVAFLGRAETAFLATASCSGQPYVQHRGGPPGFIRQVGPTTLGWAEYTGNRQYISRGNLSENDRAALIVVNYAERRRVKLWGRARFDPAPRLVEQLMPAQYDAQPEGVLLFEVAAWDLNCREHIPELLDAKGVAAALDALRQRVAELESENARLRSAQIAPPVHARNSSDGFQARRDLSFAETGKRCRNEMTRGACPLGSGALALWPSAGTPTGIESSGSGRDRNAGAPNAKGRECREPRPSDC